MSKTFNNELKRHYEEACKKNKTANAVYFCATSTGTTERILDITDDYVFTSPPKDKEKARPPKNNTIKESRLQAYLVKRAKADPEWLLPFEDKKWRLLDAERNFAGDDVSIEGKGHRLDILAYEADTKSFIVLELKVTRAFTKAKQEVLSYTSTIRKNLDMANFCYSVEAKNVQGYILWNALSWPPRKTVQSKDNPWGLIEYNEALLEKTKIEDIQFELVKEPD